MINVSKLPLHLLHDLKEFVENNSNVQPGKEEEHVALMSANEAMDAYLGWNGIIGYTERITEALDSIRAAAENTEVKTDPKPELLIFSKLAFSRKAFDAFKIQLLKSGWYLGNADEEAYGSATSGDWVLYTAGRKLTRKELLDLISKGV